MSATSFSIQSSRRAPEAATPTPFARRFKRMTPIVLVLAVIFGLSLAIARAYQYVTAPENFPINAVKVDGRFQYLDRELVQRIVVRYATGGFFTIDVDALHAEIVALPWVERAGVQRIWPDGIALNITEHQPIARWNGDALLTRTGEVILPPQLAAAAEDAAAWREHFTRLPFLQGETGNPALIWQRFVQADKALRSVGVALYGLHNDQRNAVTLVLENGVSLRLGRAWFDERLNRFVAVYTRYLQPQIDTISYIDLRYPNGFATGQLNGAGS